MAFPGSSTYPSSSTYPGIEVTSTAPIAVGSSSSAQLVGAPASATGTAPVSVASSASTLLVTLATGSVTGSSPVNVGSSSVVQAGTVVAVTGTADVAVGSSSALAPVNLVMVGRRSGVGQFHALSGSFWLPVLIAESGTEALDFSTTVTDPSPMEPRGRWVAFDATASETVSASATVTSATAFPLTVEVYAGDAHDVAELVQLGAGAGSASGPLALGQRVLIRAYPTSTTDVGTATVTWSVAPRPASGLLSFTTATEILETPGWLAIGVACATPGATLEFTLDGSATVVFTCLVDDLGLAAADSVLLPQLTAGGHTITVTDPTTGQSATNSFTVDLEPAAPSAMGADVPPTIDPSMVQRWSFIDPAPGGETFTFPINPSKMSSPHYVRNVTPEHTLAPSGQPIIWEGLPDPAPWTIEGSVETQAHYEAIERFYALRRRFYVVDHLSRAWVVSFESFEPVKKKSIGDWDHDYTLKFLILAVAS